MGLRKYFVLDRVEHYENDTKTEKSGSMRKSHAWFQLTLYSKKKLTLFTEFFSWMSLSGACRPWVERRKSIRIFWLVTLYCKIKTHFKEILFNISIYKHLSIAFVMSHLHLFSDEIYMIGIGPNVICNVPKKFRKFIIITYVSDYFTQ